MNKTEVKKIFIDIETTGLSPSRCGIIQIGGIIEIDGDEKQQFNKFVAPFPSDRVDEKAKEGCPDYEGENGE